MQNSPRVLQGQPFDLLPPFHEQTPLHSQLEESTEAKDVSVANLFGVK